MTNATAFWGVRAGTGSDVTCHQTISTTTGTCNGNGDGSIEYITGDAATSGERFAAWQHLGRAGLIEGSYTGASGNAASYVIVTGTNIPRIKISDGQIRFAWIGGPLNGNAQFFDGPYSFNLFEIAGSGGATLKPEEAWNIDKKLDDGKAATGLIFTAKNTSTYSPNCASTDVVSTADYMFTGSTKTCVLYYALK